jgi:uroporphyrinogen-III synthase
MASFNGVRVAVLEARRSTELAELVRRLGGEPRSAPAVREVAHLERVPAFLDALQDSRFEIAIFLTGVGVARLLQEAQRLGRIEDTVAALRTMTTVCRGPKPSAVLRQYDVPVTIRAAVPHTTTELLEALAPVALAGRAVALLHYGERHQGLAEALRARGAFVEEVCLYEWQLPEDTAALAALGREIVNGDVEAIAFTSQIQCRHLFAVAATAGFSDQLADALRSRVVVAAIGPVCADALKQYGVAPHVVPGQAKMGYLVTELAEYLETRPHTANP